MDTFKQKINTAEQIDFGDLFNESIEIFKKIWVKGLMLQLLLALLTVPLVILLLVYFFGLNFHEFKSYDFEDSETFANLLSTFYSEHLLVFLLVLIGFFFTIGLLSFIFNCGFFRIIKMSDQNQQASFSEVFYFFKSPYFFKTIALLVSNALISILAVSLCFFPVFYVFIPLLFFYPVFVYNPNLSLSEIINIAFSLGHKKWGIAFCITILNTILLSLINQFTYGIGALFLGCFLHIPIYLIYKKVIGFTEQNNNI
jgi:hypothetical protein